VHTSMHGRDTCTQMTFMIFGDTYIWHASIYDMHRFWHVKTYDMHPTYDMHQFRHVYVHTGSSTGLLPEPVTAEPRRGRMDLLLCRRGPCRAYYWRHVGQVSRSGRQTDHRFAHM
jgi:hypothetical protein